MQYAIKLEDLGNEYMATCRDAGRLTNRIRSRRCYVT